MMPETEIVNEIRNLFTEKLMVEVESPEQNLLATGVLDSLRLVELLFCLEQQFGIRIVMDELDTEDLRSLDSIAQFVSRQRDPVSVSQV